MGGRPSEFLRLPLIIFVEVNYLKNELLGLLLLLLFLLVGHIHALAFLLIGKP